MRQHIVVCTEDAVLAKKVRFLLARDECEVEIVGTIADVEARIRAGDVSLVVLSRQTEGGDAIATARQYDASMGMPTTIILGGAPEETAPFIRLIPDPIDTQAIYRIASDALADAEAADDDLTAAEVDLSADDPTRLEPAPAAPEPVDLQPEIYDEATALDAFDSNFADAEPVPAMGFSDEPIDAPGFEATPFDDSAYQIAPEPPMVEAEPDLPPRCRRRGNRATPTWSCRHPPAHPGHQLGTTWAWLASWTRRGSPRSCISAGRWRREAP